MLSMFYLNFTKGGNYELPSSLRHNEVLSRASLIIFLFLFTFIMSNALVSIIIIRYKYLRSAVQLDNEANGRIFREVGREYNRKLLNLLFWRKPGYKLKTLDRTEKETFRTFENFTLYNRIKFNLQILCKQNKPKPLEEHLKEVEYYRLVGRIICTFFGFISVENIWFLGELL